MEQARTEAWNLLEKGAHEAALIMRGEARAYERLMHELAAPEQERVNGDLWKRQVTGRTYDT